MASDEALLNICTRSVDQNYGESGENMRGKCCKMKDHLELLINEPKTSELIIKILQEDIKLTSIGPRKQDNLTNCALYKSHDESHPTIDKNGAWKEIRRTRATAMRHKRYKRLRTQSHYHRIVITLCVMIRKVTIPSKYRKIKGGRVQVRKEA